MKQRLTQRPIQLRVWDGERMLGEDRPVAGRFMLSAGGRLFEWDDEAQEYAGSDHVVLQWTGLTDADGREIYEGDVVAFDGQRALVRWSLIESGWVAQTQTQVAGRAAYVTLGGDMRVVGNVFEPQEGRETESTEMTEEDLEFIEAPPIPYRLARELSGY